MINQPYSLDQLINLQPDSAYYQQVDQYSTIRDQAVHAAAMRLGVQAGLNYESNQIDAILAVHAPELDRVFNFNLLLSRNNVLPPVITTASNTLSINPLGTELHANGRTYQIIQQVRFVTVPPTWRDYLWQDYPQPTLPNKVLLPTDSTEQAIWQQSIVQGWNAGVAQAVSIFKINLNRLHRDYTGMIRYKVLLAEHMVSPYYVKSQDFGITGSGNQINIDDRTWQIGAYPQLQIHSHIWQPILLDQSGE